MLLSLPQPGEKWNYLPRNLATAETPPWMIQRPADKRLMWEWEGKQRVLQEGRCASFDSPRELFALVKFMEGRSDFTLIYGPHQVPLRLEHMMKLSDSHVQFSFDNLPDEPPAVHVHDVRKIKVLWVIQLPWNPIPYPYRWWLTSVRRSAPLLGSRDADSDDTVSAAPFGDVTADDAPDGFTWVPFFKELAETVMTYRDRQTELVDILRMLQQDGRKIGSLHDEGTANVKVPLTVQDPFTFFSHFCRAITFQNKRDIFADLRDLWHISAPVPTDLWGVPQANNQKAWFFSFEHSRKLTDIDSLWNIAEQAMQGRAALTEDAWKQALNVGQVGLAKLTMGMFWLNPDEFLPLDQNIRAYLTTAGLTVPQYPTLPQYRALIEEAADHFGKSFAEISYDAFRKTPLPSPDPILPEDLPMPDYALNTILYGPPGTGKTYATATRALELVDGPASMNREELMERYKQRVRDGRISFVTFHQSYSYEDFVEGLRPVLEEETGDDAEDNGTTRYRIRDGIFKALALRAMAAAIEPIPGPPSQPARIEFRALWNRLLEKIELNPDAFYHSPANGRRYQLDIGTEKTIYTRGQAVGDKVHRLNCGRDRMNTVFTKLRDKEAITTRESYEALERNANHSLFVVVFRLLKEIEAEMQNEPASAIVAPPTESEQEETAAHFIANGTASGYRLKPAAQQPRFVLVIDEINRGNISKILGELITLLEDNKRYGMEDERTVTLPYSGKAFCLPPNLYLLGTMNTADKSIALVDIALRRRFEFEELRPDFSVCTGLSDQMHDVLNELNRRITLRKDRDHRIGHAYFIKVEKEDKNAFNRVFARKIIPLLGEYFYGDWEGLRWVLGDKNDDKGFVRKTDSGNDRAIRNPWQWYVDTDTASSFDPLATLVANLLPTAPQSVTSAEP